MAAGLGYIEFATGDVLTAALANGYLASQTVMVFASAAARTSAITSPQEGMFSYLKDTNATEYYTGSAWAALGGGGGGKVLQVVYGSYSTETNVTSSTFVDTGLTATITPSSATSKVLVLVAQYVSKFGDIEGKFKLVRAGTDILSVTTGNTLYTATSLQLRHVPMVINYLDSPATTSATIYKTQFGSTGSTFSSNSASSSTSQIILMEIGA